MAPRKLHLCQRYGSGMTKMVGILHYPEGPLYHHNQTPNSLVPDEIRGSSCVNVPEAPCTGAYTAWNARMLTMTARSNHTGGVNLLMGDSSATFIQESVDLAVWQALATPGQVDGERVAN